MFMWMSSRPWLEGERPGFDFRADLPEALRDLSLLRFRQQARGLEGFGVRDRALDIVGVKPPVERNRLAIAAQKLRGVLLKSAFPHGKGYMAALRPICKPNRPGAKRGRRNYRLKSFFSPETNRYPKRMRIAQETLRLTRRKNGRTVQKVFRRRRSVKESWAEYLRRNSSPRLSIRPAWSSS